VESGSLENAIEAGPRFRFGNPTTLRSRQLLVAPQRETKPRRRAKIRYAPHMIEPAPVMASMLMTYITW
jgi:hypothetical protein